MNILLDLLPYNWYIYRNNRGEYEIYSSYQSLNDAKPIYYQEEDESNKDFVDRIIKKLND